MVKTSSFLPDRDNCLHPWSPRFRLRTLLIVTAVCGILLAPLAMEFERYRREAAVIAVLVERAERASFQMLVGRDEAWWGLAYPVFEIDFYGSVTHRDLNQLEAFSGLQNVKVSGAKLGAAELTALARLANLRSLDLSHCQIEPETLMRLAHLNNLHWLQLNDTGVPDSAIAELQAVNPRLEVWDD